MLRASEELPTVELRRLGQIPLLASLSPPELAVAATWVDVEQCPAETVIALLSDDSTRRTATVRSTTAVNLFSLEQDHLRILLRSQPRIAEQVSRLA